MVQYKDWTENERKSSQCLKDLQIAWGTIAHDHFKDHNTVWRFGNKGLAEDFSTVLSLTIMND